MSEHGPTDDLPQVPFDEPAGRTSLDGRALRAVLAGVAGVAVIGGGALGFAWLSSTPGGSTASAAGLPGVVSTPSADGSATTPSSVAFNVSGRDVFTPLVTPRTGEGASGEGTSGEGGTTTGSTTGSTSSGATSAAASAAPTSAVAKPSAVGAKPTAAGTKPPTAVPAPPAPTPTVSRSTAPAWQQGVVTFKEIPLGSTTGAGTFVLDSSGANPVTIPLTAGSTIPSTSTVYRPWGTTAERGMTDAEKATCEQQVKKAATSEDAAKISRSTKDCTVTDDYVWQAVFVPLSQSKLAVTNQEDYGWVSTAGTQLADAVVGKVTGTVRWIGARGEKYLVQVNDEPGVWVKKGEVVAGTTLTFEGIGLAPIERTDVAVFSSGGTKYFTVLGGGENAGITF
ncbi:hypothetical protein AB2L27_02805 [Kineococcus sp. LSe6-4]|uniref:Uncharacterized protein n=1 Tax=Kineococcus halophytocola TaxID=3234027 RepID=A0ABV4GWL4_9ACTN